MYITKMHWKKKTTKGLADIPFKLGCKVISIFTLV